MRVVSLACSNTEIVCALGCGDLLVGVDDHSDYPQEIISTLPRVGPDLDIDVDAVAALKPDLVLASLTVPGHEKNIEKLEQKGLPYIAPEPVSLEDTYRDIREIAHALHVEDRGEALIQEMQAVIPAAPATPKEAPTLLVQWWPKPVIAPGNKSWIHDLIERAGGHNPLGHEDVKSRPLTDEEIAKINPDAVIISWCGVPFEKYRPDVIYRNEAWQDLPFVQEKRVFCISEAYMGRPSPRLVDGFLAIKQIVEQLQADHTSS